MRGSEKHAFFLKSSRLAKMYGAISSLPAHPPKSLATIVFDFFLENKK